MTVKMDIPQDRDTVIRIAQNKVIERMKADPGAARCLYQTTGRIEQGLSCDITQGRFATRTDLGRGMGGDASAPSPGFLARAAICGCVSTAIKMLSAREDVAFHSVEVRVDCDMDDSALFGLGACSAAPIHTALTITINSDAPRKSVRDLVTRAVGMATWYVALGGSKSVTLRQISENIRDDDTPQMLTI